MIVATAASSDQGGHRLIAADANAGKLAIVYLSKSRAIEIYQARHVAQVIDEGYRNAMKSQNPYYVMPRPTILTICVSITIARGVCGATLLEDGRSLPLADPDNGHHRREKRAGALSKRYHIFMDRCLRAVA